MFNRRKKAGRWAAAAYFFGVACAAVPSTAFAAAPAPAPAGCAPGEVCPGAMIDAGNLTQMKNAKFAGRRIGDMLPERLEWQIRERSLTLRLVAPTPHPHDPYFDAASARNRREVQLDGQSGRLVGWTVGAPFPDIDMNDANAGIKVIWNQSVGRQYGNSLDQPKFVYLLIDGVAGLERKQIWTYRQINLKGRYGPQVAPVMGSGEILQKALIFATEPQDIKGVGTFTVRYDTGKVDDSWAYVRDVRRIRRLSGGAWMTPIGSTDELGDDFSIFGGYPTWYRGFRLLDKRTILVVANSAGPSWVDTAASLRDEFPHIDLASAPHWNPLNDWEPREVYVVEAIPPSEHPYGRKIIYIDAENWIAYFGEAYDHQNSFWKGFLQGIRVWPNELGPDQKVVWVDWGSTFDFRRNHATTFTSHQSWTFSAPLTEEDVSLAVLEAQGR